MVRRTYRSDEVLAALLPAAEAEWIAAQSLRPLQLLGFIRRELFVQFSKGNVAPHIHWKLEEDIKELDLVVGGCERLFSSPLPPTMSRHVVRAPSPGRARSQKPTPRAPSRSLASVPSALFFFVHAPLWAQSASCRERRCVCRCAA